jgi:hypothetical protein
MATLEETRTELRTWLADLEALKTHAENFSAKEFVEARDAALVRAKLAAKEYALAVNQRPPKP